MRILILEPAWYPSQAEDLLRQCGVISRYNSDVPLSEALSNAEVLVVRLKYLIDKEFLDQAQALQIISTATTGLDHIDLITACARGIAVLSLKGEQSFLKTVTATAEHAWALLLALIRHIPAAHQSVVSGVWDRTQFFGQELQGRTLGIVGLGRIGEMVAHYGLAFRMRVIAFDPARADWMPGVERVAALQELLPFADVVSLHVPLTESTRHLIGKEQFRQVKKGCMIVNTSRGALVDEAALLEALKCGHLGGAALDVIQDEYEENTSTRTALVGYAVSKNNLIITPHLGGATYDSLAKVEIFMAGKVRNFIKEKSR